MLTDASVTLPFAVPLPINFSALNVGSCENVETIIFKLKTAKRERERERAVITFNELAALSTSIDQT